MTLEPVTLEPVILEPVTRPPRSVLGNTATAIYGDGIVAARTPDPVPSLA